MSKFFIRVIPFECLKIYSKLNLIQINQVLLWTLGRDLWVGGKQEGRKHKSVNYICPQCFIITYSYLLALVHCWLLLNYDWLEFKCPNVSTSIQNLQKGYICVSFLCFPTLVLMDVVIPVIIFRDNILRDWYTDKQSLTFLTVMLFIGKDCNTS